jgi:PIN domain nuclease of toxin-antitoxin system
MTGLPLVLLDTCALIYIANGEPITEQAREAAKSAIVGQGVLVSPVSACEIGLLSTAKRPVTFLPDPKTYFADFLSRSGVRLTPLSPNIAIESSHLPQPVHGDPADRMLIATARALNVPIVTRDRLILAYARAGHVQAVAC